MLASKMHDLACPPPPTSSLVSKCIVVLSAYRWVSAYNHESYIYWKRDNLNNKERPGSSGETIHRGASKTEFSDVGSIHDSHSR